MSNFALATCERIWNVMMGKKDVHSFIHSSQYYFTVQDLQTIKPRTAKLSLLKDIPNENSGQDF